VILKRELLWVTDVERFLVGVETKWSPLGSLAINFRIIEQTQVQTIADCIKSEFDVLG
jgi:hypothetical protein